MCLEQGRVLCVKDELEIYKKRKKMVKRCVYYNKNKAKEQLGRERMGM